MTKGLAERFKEAGVECYETQGQMVAQFQNISDAIRTVATMAELLCIEREDPRPGPLPILGRQLAELQHLRADSDSLHVVLS